MKKIRGFFLLSTALWGGVAEGRAQDLSAPGWHRLSNQTILRGVCPDNGVATNGSPYAFNDNCGGVTSSWSSAVIDTKRGRMIVWGGGHADYSGNEVYAVQLTGGGGDPVIARLTDPNLNICPPYNYDCPGYASAAASVNPANGRNEPVSRHTYDGLAYLPENPSKGRKDKMFMFGGSKAPVGFAGGDTWIFDLESNAWEERSPMGDIPRDNYTSAAAYDPLTDRILMHDDTALYAYTYETDQWLRISETGSGKGYSRTAALDPNKKIFLLMTTSGVYAYEIDPSRPSYANGVLTAHVILNTGDTGLVGTPAPGVAYDPVRREFVAWNGGRDVYSLDIDSTTWQGTWTRLNTPADRPDTTEDDDPGPMISGPDYGIGTFNHWDYVPALGAFAVINYAHQPVFVYRIGPGTVQPSLPPPPRRLRVR